MADLNILIRKRAAVKSKLTNFTNYLDRIQQNAINVKPSEDVVSELQLRCEKASKLLDEFEQFQLEIEVNSDDEETQQNVRSEFEDAYFSIITAANQFIKKNLVSVENDSEGSASGGSIASAGASTSNTQAIKLPTIQLPKFEGFYESWLEFRDTFESLIHLNSSINKIQKFHYLRASLGGDAGQVIKSLEFSADNYEIAWNILCERYNNTRLLTNNHIKSLFNLDSIAKRSSDKLRNMIDSVNKHLRALQTMGEPVESWDTLLIYLVTTKLDSDTLSEWEQKRDKKSSKLGDLISFLKSRADILETIEIETNANKSQKNTNKLNTKSFFTNNIKCEFCEGDHYIQHCSEFKKLNVNARIEKVKNLKLCINCLRKGHYSKDCKFGRCRFCSSKHNSLLHIDKRNTTSNNNERSVSVAFSSKPSIPESQVLLSTALIKVLDIHGKYHTARVLLDAGSQSSFITTSLCDILQLEKIHIDIKVGGFNQSISNINSKCQVNVSSNQNKYRTVISCLVISNITGSLPNFKVDVSKLSIPPNIRLADPGYDKPDRIDMLLGADLFWDLICVGQIKLNKNGPILQKTRFGWVLAGPVNSIPGTSIQCNFSKNISENDLQRFWEIENFPNNKILSSEEKYCEEHFVKNTFRNEAGRFNVTIPFKGDISKLGDSKNLALKRFSYLERKLQNNGMLRELYCKFMQEYIDLGHMKEIGNQFDELVSYYMPHHGVLKENSSTTKLRVVFDGSAVTSSGYSINNLQMVGPTIQEDLFSILLRFRSYNYVFCADIEKMYRQVEVNHDQCRFQRILWRFNPSEPLKTYELKTVTYGTASASFLAIRSLYQLGIDCEECYPNISNIIKRDFYVDDLMSGANSVDECINLCKSLANVLEKGCFKLRKWLSNSPEVMVALDEELQSSDIVNMGKQENTKTLGLYWSKVDDCLLYSISNYISKGVTKRKIISDISQIFDPLGLLTPCIIIAKILIQKLWLEKLSWDEALPLVFQTEWVHLRNELVVLNELRINRHVVCSNPINIQLHGFCDSSSVAYGAVVYVRSKDADGNICVNLLTSKSKVAPLKTLTIPRLELCGALILSQLLQKVKNSVRFHVDDIFYWTDSTIVLGWLRTSPHLLQVFVGNRVAQIQTLSNIDKWHHVPTKCNPADLLSRGVYPKQLLLMDIWWHGPDWLQDDECLWPNLEIYENNLPEMRKQIESQLTTKNSTDYFPFDKYSCFYRLKRIIAYCLRFKHNCLNYHSKKVGFVSTEELDNAEICLLKIAQSECFSSDLFYLQNGKRENINKSLLSLTPFLCPQGLIRVGGRLSNSNFSFDKKHPVLLSSKHKLTKLLVNSEHKRLLHAGPQMLLASIRDKYWLLGGRNLCRHVVRSCVGCFRANPNVTTQIMGNLPVQRLTPAYPFSKTGVDYAGPVLIKDRQGRGCKVTKAYIAVFICFCTKAIHLELVSSLTTDCFIACLNRFSARRGKPAEMFSDNGKNFCGANHELRELHEFFKVKGDDIAAKSANVGIQWHFIPPNSPHFGGLWEAGVKSTKFHLKRVTSNALMTFEQLYTLLTQIEAILNSRPLIPLSNDPNDLTAITPAHFLIGRELTSVASQNFENIPENRLNIFQRIQQVRQHFWKRWYKEYISELQQRLKWKSTSQSLKCGDIVLVKDDNLPPLKWKLGRITQLYNGSDGVARVASIRTASGVIKRAYSKICPLPINYNASSQDGQ
ncbi:uncharacterized protein LOC115880817 [Sitophilus oryzae]|uniref:Uncharacterized protein LOC115880817 n=1 Tax=Sitophilus oryzae TaxID=7048 RepID=A0A6J2XSG3_SITOR|nr:uncharacterized protein LOC115880817 [Sitophilus oryzae]